LNHFFIEYKDTMVATGLAGDGQNLLILPYATSPRGVPCRISATVAARSTDKLHITVAWSEPNGERRAHEV